MENELQVRQDSAPVREIGVITEEIRNIRQQANAMALLYAVEIGRRLVEAKRVLPHGKWGEWLQNEVDFSQSTATNLMRLFEEYGSSQISIFGASVDSQTFANLPYSKALALLAVPREEREAFATEVGADDLSVRELKAAIEERDRQTKIAEAQKKIKEELAERLQQSEEARLDALLKADEAEKLKNELAEAEQLLARERQNAAELAEQLKKAEQNPQIPKVQLNKIRKEAEEAAVKAAGDAAKKELAAAKEKAAAAEVEAVQAKLMAKQAEERAEEAEKRLKTASPEIAAFKALFDEVQTATVKLRGMIDKIGQTDRDTADKLTAALHAFGAAL